MSNISLNEQLHNTLDFVNNNHHSSVYKDVPVLSAADINEKFSTITIFSKLDLIKYKDSLNHYPEEEIRYLVSEFDGENVDSLFLIPQKIDTQKELVSRLLKDKDPTVAILSVPLFWQIGPMFYHTSRKLGVPVSVISPRNLPLACQVIKEVDAHMMVTTPEYAPELQTLLKEKDMEDQIHTWVLIAQLDSTVACPSLSGDVYVDYHIFPGVSVGHTSSKLLEKGIKGFIPTSDYFFEIQEGGACLITSRVPHALPFIRFKIADKAERSTYEDQDIIIIHEPIQ